MLRSRRPILLRREDTESLDRHSEAILAGTERDAPLDGDNPQELTRLIGVVRHLAKTLVPVEPSPDYVGSLKARLADMHSRQVAAAQEVAAQRGLAQNPQILRTVLSIFAIAALAARLVASIVMVVAILANRRRRSAAAL
jgi:hypothetical protein